VLLVAVVAVGVFFVNRREGWISVSFSEKRSAAKEYSPDVLGIADQAEKLNATARRSWPACLPSPTRQPT